MECDDAIDVAARMLLGARHAVALTGAGVSVASGVPDFRSAGGLWERFEPAEYATIDAFTADPDRVWDMFRAAYDIMATARPNAGHQALASLEREGALRGVVTQNIDGLHRRAGNRVVVEYHGSLRDLVCVGCGYRTPARRRRIGGGPGAPRCRCGNALKPDAVLFGEMIPLAAVDAALRLAKTADLLLVIGTSATVSPASELPLVARAGGARVVEFNVGPTLLTAHASDLLVAGPAEETLPQVVEALGILRAAC